MSSTLAFTGRVPFDALATAIQARLAADFPALKFFSLYVPDGEPPLPYVVLDQMAATDESTKESGVWGVECQFRVFTEGFGAKQATDLMNQVEAALGRDSMAIALAGDFKVDDVVAGNPSLVLVAGDGFIQPFQEGLLPLTFHIRDLHVG